MYVFNNSECMISILKTANYCNLAQARAMLWLSLKAEKSLWWALVLTVFAVYQIAEHVVFPLISVVELYIHHTGVIRLAWPF